LTAALARIHELATWPWTREEYGPLPIMFVLLTVVAGLVDAVSFIALDHVFVANMTGNVVFVGFALGGAPGLSAVASLSALAAFVVGAVVGGKLIRRSGSHHARLMRAFGLVKVPLVLGATVIAIIVGNGLSQAGRYAIIVPLAMAMGVQNAAVRRVNVPGLRTTLLTLTITGMAADPASRHAGVAEIRRGLISVVAMFLGALIGGLLVVNAHIAVPIALAALLQIASTVIAHRNSAVEAAWAHPTDAR
jgi:uncharacterized membrane protein YoaK (UPF0700 family)